MIEAFVEALGRLTEQDFSFAARNRIQNLATFSGFQHYIDPSFGLGMIGSIHDHSMYRSPQEAGLIISVDFNRGAGPMPWSGDVSFIDTIPDTDIVVRNISHSFISDGEARTIFPEPRDFTMLGDTQARYPLDKQVPPSQNPWPEEEGELVTEPASDFIDVQIDEFMRKHWDDMISGIMNHRTQSEVAENRIRLAQLIGRIDAIDPQRDLIIPPTL